jgi:23S rRNA pseudouridine1911/1915/1917 synthase
MGKSYLAVVEGRLRPGKIAVEKALVPSPDGRRMSLTAAGEENALSARSDIELVRGLEHGSLVRVRADRARRHQVRAHLASIGHPLAGDGLYGAKTTIQALESAVLAAVPPPHEGFLLHSERLTFVNPVTGDRIELGDSPDWAGTGGSVNRRRSRGRGSPSSDPSRR